MNYSHAIGWLFLITFIVIKQARGESLGPYMKRHLAIDPRHIECSKNGSIKILVVDNPPYVITRNTSLNNGVAPPVGGVLVDFFMSAIRMCYKECNITFQAFDNVKELLQAIHDYQGNIAFPVASTMAVNLTWPWYKGTPIVLQSAIQGKDRALIIHKGNYNQWLKDTMFNNLFKSWPLFALTFVFAGLSGICVWILECQSNGDDFGASFSRGWFEGFWWAFVSMTTVGYGDKTPRTVLGRLFASVWIAFGLVMVAMFTATASNAIMSLEFNGIAQAEVGVLSSTDASHQAAKHGAIPKRFKSFKAMRDALYADEVNAILIDQYVGAYFIDILKSDDLRMLASLSYEYTYSIAFLDDQSQHIQMECFKNIQNRYGTSSFLERYTKQLKIFDFNTDFPGLFTTEGRTGYLFISGIALSVIVITGTVIDQLNKKYNLFGNRIFRKCCKTRIVEMSKDKTFTRDDRRGNIDSEPIQNEGDLLNN
ncbi:putative potassium channel protein [Exaiptasia diaphana]|nr:putative potassium channel protein [Exaiptasia diaphana]